MNRTDAARTDVIAAEDYLRGLGYFASTAEVGRAIGRSRTNALKALKVAEAAGTVKKVVTADTVIRWGWATDFPSVVGD